MDKELQKLHLVFYTSDMNEDDAKEEYFKDGIAKLNQLLGTSIEPSKNALAEVIDKIFDSDNVEALELLLTGDLGFGYDLDYCDNYFEEGDWFDDDEEHEEMEEEYGEEGYQYYDIYTKSKIHVFSQSRPFADEVQYEETKDR
jgi:hypothetical protein